MGLANLLLAMPQRSQVALRSCALQRDAASAVQCIQSVSLLQDDVSEHPERFFVGEIIREKIFEQYQQEVPYATMVCEQCWLSLIFPDAPKYACQLQGAVLTLLHAARFGLDAGVDGGYKHLE